jgi:dienelactone hydrolase
VSIPGSASGRTVPATIYTPTGASGARPLVVVSPGFQMPRTQYASYADHLASWGFVVALCDYADSGFFADHQKLADDVSSVIDWALAHETIDAAKIATAGHSLGGDISTLAAADDARVAAVVGWDPVDASNPSVVPEKMTSFHAALAVVGETTDGSGGGMPCAPSADNFQQFYAAAPAPAVQLTLAGADHMDWVDDGSCAFCGLCTAGPADPSLAHTTTRRLTVAWLLRVLDGDTTMDPWLDAPPEAGTAVTRK